MLILTPIRRRIFQHASAEVKNHTEVKWLWLTQRSSNAGSDRVFHFDKTVLQPKLLT